MIDKITLVKNNISNLEKLQIIDTNNLQFFGNENGTINIYDNAKVKNLTGGFLIKIYNDKLKIQGSVHKYFNFLKNKKLENYNLFSMQDFTQTIHKLFINIGVSNLDFLVVDFEIGLNILVGENDPKEFLRKAQSIGKMDGKERIFYINPKYKDGRFLCTQMHKDNTVIFRIYDKNFERTDKGKKNEIPPIVRIETLRTRQKNLSLIDFLKVQNLTILQSKFFAEWNLLNFEKEVIAPNGTHQSKKNIAKEILLNGTIPTLENLEYRREQITPKIYKTSKHFIKYWDNYKVDFYLIPTKISPKWDELYNITIQQLTKINIKN